MELGHQLHPVDKFIWVRVGWFCVFIQVTDPSGNCAPAFNAQQLEECDAFPLETSLLVRLDARTHDVSHRVSIMVHRPCKFMGLQLVLSTCWKNKMWYHSSENIAAGKTGCVYAWCVSWSECYTSFRGATTPIVLIIEASWSHLDTAHLAGFLWMNDWYNAETGLALWFIVSCKLKDLKYVLYM